MTILSDSLKYLISKSIYFLVPLLLVVLVNVSVFADGAKLLQQQTLLSHQDQIDSSVLALKKNKNYEFIFFYSTGCPHCMIFDRVLRQYSDNSGITVKAFVIGQGVSPSFPDSIVVDQEVVEQFFGKGAQISVPALFILNKDNFHAYPVSRGSLTYSELTMRMNELVPKVLTYEKYEKYKKNEKHEKEENAVRRTNEIRGGNV